jgi:hypothetical protein
MFYQIRAAGLPPLMMKSPFMNLPKKKALTPSGASA